MQFHIVYKLTGSNWNVTYYGKTEHHFNVRSSEHLGISHLTGKRVEWKPSVASNHLLLHYRDSDFNNFTILCRYNNRLWLFFQKLILISRDFRFRNKETTLFHYYYLITLRFYQWDLDNFLDNIFWYNKIKLL